MGVHHLSELAGQISQLGWNAQVRRISFTSTWKKVAGVGVH